MNGTEKARKGGFWRRTAKSLLLILLCAALGTGVLILSEFLPEEPMQQHLRQSADIFQATGKFPNLYTWCSSKLDNYSDAIMLMMAGNVSKEKPVEYAMMSYHGVMGAYDPVQIFVKHYIGGRDYDGYEAYSRYWHGYGVIYRLLLQFFDYHRIRQINLALQAGLLLLLCGCMFFRAGRQGRGMILPLLICWAMLSPMVMGLNLEYSLGFYISLLAVLTALILRQRGALREKEYMVLLFAGICTAYWDVLTYPMAALGMPLVACFCLEPDRKIRDALARLVRLCFFWGLGYGGMWVSKWIIGTALTGRNVFEEGISSFVQRTGSEAYGEAVTVGETIGSNLDYYLNTPFRFLILAFLLAMAGWLLIRLARKQTTLRAFGGRMLPFFVIACIPFVWCAVTKNHANVHYWLASKGFTASSMALMCGMFYSVRGERGDAPDQAGRLDK